MADLRSVLLEGLNAPFGMALVGTDLYVANTDAIRRFPCTPGQTRITAPGVLVTRLPAGPVNHHWTKKLIASADGRKLFVTGGSNSNVDERGMAAKEERAAIWEVDIASGAHRVYASALRNPNGMFIGQHGSWNRRPHSGYRVIFVPLGGSRPTGAQPLDVLTGFLDDEGRAYGRPVGVAVDSRGGLLVADDVGQVIWRVTAAP